jgi:hypothetical protein
VPEKVTLRIPAHLALLVKPGAPVQEKMKVINGGVTASAFERVTLLFFLCYDDNQEVKSAALSEIKRLPLQLAADIHASPDTHPRLREFLARTYRLSTETEPPVAPEEPANAAEEFDEEHAGDPDGDPEEEQEEWPDEEQEEEPEEEPLAEDEAYQSKYQLAQAMGVGDKIKMALTGDKEWRSLLIKDSNKLVNSAVVKNPRITEPEILSIAKSVIQNDEILRIICQNKEWIKNYSIRKALVLNNKTPLPVALRFMGFLTEKDLQGMAKSKNISSVLANNARRALTSKKKS